MTKNIGLSLFHNINILE